MREQVCIVLNEREPTKAKAAEALVAQLKSSSITASRIPVTEQLPQILKQRQARLVVLDYLLGDYSTGLDILSHLQALDEERRPKVVFLTDEPSIQVAVDALRGGALHYVELDDPQAILKVAREIESVFRGDVTPPLPAMSLPAIDDLILSSPAGRALEAQMRAAAARQLPIICVTGQAGSGLSTIAHTLLTLSPQFGYARTISLRTFDGSLLSVAGISPSYPALRLGNGLSLIVEYAEEEDGSLLQHVAREKTSLWNREAEPNSTLIIVSSDESLVQAWHRQTGAEIIRVPTLTDRADDMAALVQRFVRKAEEYGDKRVKPFPPDAIAWLAKQAWPGQLRELESVVIDTALGGFAEDALLSNLEARMKLWEDSAKLAGSEPLNPLTAAAVLEDYNFSYQSAAARLGCSVRQLHAVLGRTSRPGEDA